MIETVKLSSIPKSVKGHFTMQEMIQYHAIRGHNREAIVSPQYHGLVPNLVGTIQVDFITEISISKNIRHTMPDLMYGKAKPIRVFRT